MDWLRPNKLNLKVAKCEYMYIGNLDIYKDEMKRVSKAKYLVRTID